MFVSKHKASWGGGFKAVEGGGTLFRNRDQLETKLRQERGGLVHAFDTAHGKPEQGSGRGLDGVFVDGGGTRGWHHQSRGSEALGRARNGAQVAHVRDAIQRDHEGRLALLKSGKNHFVEGLEFDGRRERHDALVVLHRDPIKSLLGHGLRRHFHFPALPQNLRHFVGLFSLEKQHTLEGLAFVQGFQHGVNAKQECALRGTSVHGGNA